MHLKILLFDWFWCEAFAAAFRRHKLWTVHGCRSSLIQRWIAIVIVVTSFALLAWEFVIVFHQFATLLFGHLLFLQLSLHMYLDFLGSFQQLCWLQDDRMFSVGGRWLATPRFSRFSRGGRWPAMKNDWENRVIDSRTTISYHPEPDESRERDFEGVFECDLLRVDVGGAFFVSASLRVDTKRLCLEDRELLLRERLRFERDLERLDFECDRLWLRLREWDLPRLRLLDLLLELREWERRFLDLDREYDRLLRSSWSSS